MSRMTWQHAANDTFKPSVDKTADEKPIDEFKTKSE